MFDALSNEWLDTTGVARQRQARYLTGYLKHFDTKTIIVENDYVDRDYLEDYACFYVHSFQPYPRLTRRLHFFCESFTETEIAEAFSGRNDPVESRMRQSYLGFVVARPLPVAVVGRTILRTYETGDGQRAYPVTRDYEPNLFGISLSIKNSLAYQQQDTVVAACATVALWSAFHKTQRLFESARPTPAQITRDANLVRGSGRAMPSHSLTPEQIGQAITSVGLEPEYVEINSETPLSTLIYSYASMGIPVILLVYLRDMGFHAMTVVGYGFPDGDPDCFEPPCPVPYRGRKIDRFFVHDDNVGPFAYVRIAKKPTMIEPDNEEAAEHFSDAPFALEVVWHEEPGTKNVVECAPLFAVVPIDPKIRLTFFGVHGWLAMLGLILKEYQAAFKIDEAAIEWDLRLQRGNDLKIELRKDAKAMSKISEILITPYPSALWRATMHAGGRKVLDVFADATEVDTAFPFLDIVYYDAELGDNMRQIFGIEGVRKKWAPTLGTAFVDFLAAN